MTDKLLAKRCAQCGAKLTLQEDELLCEYCGSSYELPKDYVKTNIVNEQKGKFSSPPLNPTTSQIQSDSANPSTIQKESRSKNNCLVWLVVLFLLGGLVTIILPKILERNEQHEEPISRERETESRMFRQLPGDLEYPADFFHGQPLSVGAIMDGAAVDEFEVSIVVKNELSRNIEANLKADQLIIESAEVVDNLSNHYACKFDNFFTGSEVIGPSEIEWVGSIYCEPAIQPEVKFVKLNVTFTNWGNYSFQIPLDSVKGNLNFEYGLYRSDNNFQIWITFYSTPPQYIAIYFNDISVVDDKGNYYNLDHCSDGIFDISTDRLFYAYMANNSGMGNAKIFCTFTNPIPFEVNAVTLVLNIRGNTVTHIFTTDTIK